MKYQLQNKINTQVNYEISTSKQGKYTQVNYEISTSKQDKYTQVNYEISTSKQDKYTSKKNFVWTVLKLIWCKIINISLGNDTPLDVIIIDIVDVSDVIVTWCHVRFSCFVLMLTGKKYIQSTD